MEEKACPIVLRDTEDGVRILLFRHPLAGVQLVKGGIHPGETPTQAAVRELFEESGLIATGETYLSSIDFADLDQRWHIFRCDVGPTHETWSHNTLDDDGQRFAFFWHLLDAPLPDDLGTAYRKVISKL